MSDSPTPPDDFIPSSLHAHVSPIPTARPIILTVVDAKPPHPMMLCGLNRWHVLIDIAAMAILVVLVEWLTFLSLSTAYGVTVSPDGELDAGAKQALIVPLITIRAFVIFFLVGVFVCIRRQSMAAIGLSVEQLWLNLLIGVVSCVGLFLCGYALLSAISLVFPEFLKQLQKNTDALLNLLPQLNPMQSAVFMLMVGVYEEVLFRGFLLPRIRRLTGGWAWAVLLSTVIFVVLHAGDQVPAALTAITGLSLAFSVLTIWRRSIVPAITAHFLFNLVQLLVINYQRDHLGL